MLHPTRTLSHHKPLQRSNAMHIKASAILPSQGTGSHTGKKAIVIGSGFGGLGAAWSLSKAGADVLLLDAAPQPGGLSAVIKTPKGRVVEPGIKGFWYQYANLTHLVTDELGLREADVFTAYTEVGR